MDGTAGWTMMNVVSSLLIVALFAYWVRELKHQILGLQKHVSPAAPPPVKPASTPQQNVVLHRTEHKAPAETAATAPAASRHAIHRSRDGNVPVWTIE